MYILEWLDYGIDLDGSGRNSAFVAPHRLWLASDMAWHDETGIIGC